MKKIIKAIIIDDQIEAINSLKQDVLSLFPNDIQIVGHSTAIDEAVVMFKEFKPDLIFLDIDLKVGTGFDFLKIITQFEFSDYDIIFTTAFNQFAIKAIKYSAFDYLLKPIDTDELKLSIERLKKQFETQNETKQRIDLILSQENEQGTLPEKLVLSTTNQVYFVDIKTIVRCEADHNYTIFHLADDSKIMVSKTLKEYEGILKKHNFFRTHQSHLVNFNFVVSYIKDDGGMLALSTNDNVPISRRKKDEVIAKLKA